MGPDIFMNKIMDILEKASAFFEISYRLTETMSLDVILQRVIEITNEALDAERGTLFLYDSENKELFARIALGAMNKEIRFPSHLGIAGAVFTTGQTIIIHDAYADPRFNQDVDKQTGFKTRNILCAPVKTRNHEIIGVIQLLNKRDLDFSTDDLILLEAITSQASTALQNVQLFEQLQKAKDDETQLLEVTTAISTELNLEPLLFKIMEATTDILYADRSTLFMHDERTNELWSLVAQGSESTEIRFPCHMGIAGSVFTDTKSINIEEAYNDPRFNQTFDKKSGYRTKSILCVPVINKKGISIGAIQVLNKKGGPFTRYDEKRLCAFASQASIAIENAKLFNEILDMKNYNESILECMSNGVITLNADKQIVKCNSNSTKILKMDINEFVGEKITSLFTDNNGWIIQSICKVSKTGKSDLTMDKEYFADSATDISINLNVVPLKNIKEELIGTMLVFEDISTEKRLKGTMARYMTKEVAERLLDGGETLLGGQVKEATILFSDIRRFTTISEHLGAKDTVEMLNQYFTCMVDIIFHYGGILDKYIGDAILAVYGTPFPSEDDVDNSVKASIDMILALKELNKTLKEPLSIGIGINTDKVLVGNIGSLKRMDYTVIGDGVNLASRLESANKYFGSNILISGLTHKKLKNEYKTRMIDSLKVKGKKKPVSVFEILDYHDEFSFPNLDKIIGIYNSGLYHYKRRNWKKSISKFNEALSLNPADTASEVYVIRCMHFLDNPPEDNWDGSWIMKDK
ncbi:GAF domain-containing protein [bacterium]|nr:GAF domain-containing protein [bacterium]